jgi:hypothetical protein
MSASAHLYVDGVKPLNEKYEQMKAVWDACKDAELAVPKEVLDFFEMKYEDDMDEEGPLDDGVRVPLMDVSATSGKSYRNKTHGCAELFSMDDEHPRTNIVLVNLKEVPEDVEYLRIVIEMGG